MTCINSAFCEELTESFVELDAADGVLVSLKDSRAVPELRHPGAARVVRTARVHDLVHDLQGVERQCFV